MAYDYESNGYQDPYEKFGGTQDQFQQDQSRVPSYPYLMSGQPGWPNLNTTNGRDQYGQPQMVSAENNAFRDSSGSQLMAPAGGGGGGFNTYGTGVNLSDDYLREQISAAAARSGRTLAETGDDSMAYWMERARTPDVYSDGRTRVGWNNYWADRLAGGPGTDSADPNRAGMEGVINDPGQYGLSFGGGGGGGWGGGGGGGGMYSSGGSSGGLSTGSGFSLSGNLGGFGSEQATTLWDMLMGRANQTLNIDGNDPIIRGQVDAATQQATRANRNHLADLAEREGPQANLNLERRMGAEQIGQGASALQASLMQNELTARRNEIMGAMQQMGGLLSDQQRMALQRELGLIDANLQQQRITNQNNQFLDDFSLRNMDRASYWDYARRYGL